MTSGGLQPIFNNFYTPQNEEFYTSKPYRALNHDQDDFRLLKLLPGKESDHIRCTIIEPPETLSLKYECISYRAGDPTDTVQIEVNERPFNAFSSLGEALRKLRLSEGSRLIWADQVCINQCDVVERNSQVQKMRSFYERAEAVIAWLGHISAGDVAFDAMKALHTEYTTRLVHYKQALGDSHELDRVELGSVMRSIADDVMKKLVLLDEQGGGELMEQYGALGDLYRSELWDRLWIWQELIVAKTVRLEWQTHSIDYEDFYIPARILLYLQEMEWTNPKPKSMALLVGLSSDGRPSKAIKLVRLSGQRNSWRRQTSWRQSHSLDFKSLLDSARGAKCSDPRDKVFALCGLVNSEYSIVPDYMESVQQTYYKSVIAILSRERSLDVLAYCRHPRTTKLTDALPSWCPDWSLTSDMINRRQSLLWDEFSSHVCRFQASRRASGSFRVVPGDMQNGIHHHISLFVPGLHIDSVQTLGAMPQAGHASKEELFDNLLNSWAEIVAKYCTLTTEVYRRIERTATIDDRGYPSVSSPRNVIDESNYGRLKLDVVEGNRRFFTTSNGLMGMAPPHVQVGDLVCVLLGARVPFLLRKSNGFHVLVGEVYLSHGYMHGRAIDDMDAGKIQIQEFEIR